MKKELPKIYEPQEAEGRIYQKWEEKATQVYSAIYDLLVE